MLQNLLGNASDAVSSITGEANDGSNKFRKTLKRPAFFTSDIDVNAGEYQKLGEFVVPAQEQYRFGAGAAEYEANQGYLFIDIQDASGPNPVQGTVRLQQRDAQERNIVTVFEEDTEVLRSSKTDRTQKQALPEQRNYPRVGRDSKLVVAINPDSTLTVSASDTEMLIPVTVYPV